MQKNYRAYGETIKQISGERMKKEVGSVKMEEDDGELVELNGVKLRDEIVDMVKGGKSRSQIIEELKDRGVEFGQEEKRKKIMKIIDSLFAEKK